MQTLSDLLRSRAVHFPDKTFLVCEDWSWTFGAYLDAVARLAQLLRDRGVVRGQPVCLYLPSRPQIAIGYHACQLVGAIAAPMSGMYRSGEITRIVPRTGARVLITDTERAPNIREAEEGLPSLEHVLVFGGDGRAPPLEELLARTDPLPPAPAGGPEDVAALFFTSGTTGEPKGAMQNQRNIAAALRNAEVYTRATYGEEVFLGVLPLFNNFGATVVLNGALFNGGKLVLTERWETETVLELIERHRVTLMYGTPTMFAFMVEAHDPDRHDLSSLRLAVAGGGLLAPAMVDDFERSLGIRLVNVYGATEVTSYVTGEPSIGPHARGSSGMPLGNTEIEIVDDDGTPLPPGEAGEVRIRGDCVGPGYWRDPGTTAEIFTPRGWLSGDIGTLGKNGELTIVDRKKDVIISGGFNIYPIEVEDVLYEHGDVALCALIGVADAQKGELPVAVVVPAADAGATADDLIVHCRDRLAAYKVPRRVIFRDALPLGPTGKILKRELRDMLNAGIA